MRSLVRSGYARIGRDKKAFLLLLLASLWAITMGVEGSVKWINTGAEYSLASPAARSTSSSDTLIQFDVLETWTEPSVTDYARYAGTAPYIYEVGDGKPSTPEGRTPDAFTLLLIGSLALSGFGLVKR